MSEFPFNEFELSISTKSMMAADALRVQRLTIERLSRRIEELETPDQYWDANDPEHEAFYDEMGIAEYLFDRYPEGYRHTVVCARRLPERTFKVWDDTDGTDDFVNWEIVE